MAENKIQQYVISITGVVIGIIFLGASFQVGIKDSGWVVLILGTFFGVTGILSFFNPTISKVLGQIMNNLVENQKRREMNQQQKSPNASPQTGTIHGNQYIDYGNRKKDEMTKSLYNKEKVEKRLKEIKIKLNKLKKLNHKEGNKIFSLLKKEVRGIIHKIYTDDSKSAEQRLIHKVFFVITSSTKESDYQEWYLEDVEELINSINIILREIDLE
jgi:hypothetical protein